MKKRKPSIEEEEGTDSTIRFRATVLRPKAAGQAVSWTFLILPKEASSRLPSRGQVTVEGTINGRPFQSTLEPDGQGGHWLKIERKLREALAGRGARHGDGKREVIGARDGRASEASGVRGLNPGDVVTLEIAPVAPEQEPEPRVPPDLRKALASAPPGRPGQPGAREAWKDITPAARRDFIHWITSAKQAETRARRIATACDMLAKGKRRPCCFDRSGMYSKSLSCPEAQETQGVPDQS